MSTTYRAQIADAARGDLDAVADMLANIISPDADAQAALAGEVSRCDDAVFWGYALEFAAVGTWTGRPVPGAEQGTEANERGRQFFDDQFESENLPASVSGAQEQALLNGAMDKDPEIREHAIHLLGARGHSDEGKKTLEKSLKDPSADVRQAATSALRMPVDEDTINRLARQLTESDYSTRHRARLQLTRIGEPALPALLGILQHDDDRSRWEAAKTVQGIGTAKTAPVLAATLKDENPGVRNIAIEGLVALGESAVRPVLETLISHSDEAVARSSAGHVLTQLANRGIRKDALGGVLHALSVSSAATAAPVAAEEALVKLG